MLVPIWCKNQFWFIFKFNFVQFMVKFHTFFIILKDSWLFHILLGHFITNFNPIFSQFSSCCFGQERNSRLSENNFELVSQLSGSLKLSIIYKPDEWSKTKIEYLQTWRIILRTIQLLSGVKSQKAKVSSWDYFSLISTN